MSKQLSEAGIDASDDVVAQFCEYLRQNNHVTKQKKANRPKKKAKKQTKKGPSSENPYEVAEFEARLSNWEKKVKILDKQLEACQNMQSQSAKYSSYIDEEAKNDKLSAYPYLKPDYVGRGCIHPPAKLKTINYRFPIYKNEVYSRPPHFIHEYRKLQENAFTPSAEHRHDDLRWRIRERIIYSHPDYFIRPVRKIPC